MPPSLIAAIADRLLYRSGYFRMVDATSARSAGAMAESIVAAFAPARVIDYGCGTGSLLAALRARGVGVAGTEHSGVARRMSAAKGLDPLPLDLRSPPKQPPLGTADVAVSFEVAEHLPATAADGLVGLLAATAPIVVFGAATPGQGGRGHVNEQPHDYWIAKFKSRGMDWDRPRSHAFRDSWRAAGVDFWYADNALVFRRDTSPS
jgi:SAM-dependent methyltransferase